MRKVRCGVQPVPFRLIEEGKKFRKWQWIERRVEKANKGHRVESHKLYVDTINCGDVIDTEVHGMSAGCGSTSSRVFTEF